MSAANLALQIIISAKDAASGVLGRLGRLFGDLRVQVMSLVAALGLWRAAQDGISNAARLEDLRLQFTGLLGSSEAAAAKLKELDAAFGLRQVGQAQQLFVQLTSFGLKPTVEQLKALIDFNARTGQGAENLRGIAAQLGQAWGKEKLQYEDILILLERGVPVWELLGKASGKTTAELAAMATNGELGRTAISALIAEMEKVADGASVARLKTWTGLWEATVALWDRFSAEVMQGGAFDWLKGKLQEVSDVLEYAIQSGAARRWGESFGDAIRSAGAWVEQLTSYARSAVGVLQVSVASVAAILNSIMAAIAGGLSKLIPQLNARAAKLFPNLNETLSGLKASLEDTYRAAKERAGEAVADITQGWATIGKGSASVDQGAQSWAALVGQARAFNQEAARARDLQGQMAKAASTAAGAGAPGAVAPGAGKGGAAGAGGGAGNANADYEALTPAQRLKVREELNRRRAEALDQFRAGKMTANELGQVNVDIGREEAASRGDSAAIAEKKRRAEEAQAKAMVPGLQDWVIQAKIELDPDGKAAVDAFRAAAGAPITVPVKPQITWGDVDFGAAGAPASKTGPASYSDGASPADKYRLGGNSFGDAAAREGRQP